MTLPIGFPAATAPPAASAGQAPLAAEGTSFQDELLGALASLDLPQPEALPGDAAPAESDPAVWAALAALLGALPPLTANAPAVDLSPPTEAAQPVMAETAAPTLTPVALPDLTGTAASFTPPNTAPATATAAPGRPLTETAEQSQIPVQPTTTSDTASPLVPTPQSEPSLTAPGHEAPTAAPVQDAESQQPAGKRAPTLEAKPTLPETPQREKAEPAPPAREAAPAPEAWQGLTQAQFPPAVDNTFEPARLSEARTPDLVAQVSGSVERLAQLGQGRLHVQLSPAQLGRIELHISQTPQGLSVVLQAEQAATSSLLQQHAADLQNSLAAAGLTLASVSIGVGGRQAGQPGAEGWGSADTTPRWLTPGPQQPPAADPGPERGHPAYGLRHANQVDYWI